MSERHGGADLYCHRCGLHEDNHPNKRNCPGFTCMADGSNDPHTTIDDEDNEWMNAALGQPAQPTPECNGKCRWLKPSVTQSGEAVLALADPDCPKHGDGSPPFEDSPRAKETIRRMGEALSTPTPAAGSGEWPNMPWPERALRCPHRWMQVTGITGEGWGDDKPPLYEVCLHDCGAIRQRIGGDEIMWPARIVAALEAQLAELRAERDFATGKANEYSQSTDDQRRRAEVAEVALKQAQQELYEGEAQLRYWYDTEHHCPCGAVTDDHHVPGCPTERAKAHYDALEPKGE